MPLSLAHSAGAASPQGLAPYSRGAFTPFASQFPGTGDSSNFAWATLVLQDGGWSTCTNNVNVITQWMRAEEPPTNWWDRNNPLNNGDGDGGGAGTGAYPDLPTAAHFVADNLQTGLNGYAPIESDLAACAAPATTASAIWNSSWAGGHYGYGSGWNFSAVPRVITPFTWESNAAPQPTGVQMVQNPSGAGYWLLSSSGAIYSYGGTTYYGGANTGDLNSSETAVGLAATPDGKGYWILANDGAVFSFGDAGYHGGANTGDLTNGQVAKSITADGSGSGYWILSNQGAVFSFGDAPFYGGAYGQSYFSGQTAQQLVKSGSGYWILSKSGNIYSYGSAPYEGNPAGFSGQTAVAMAASSGGTGYWVLSAAGGIYAEGSAPYLGGANGQSYFNGLTASSLAPTDDRGGYWILSTLGGVYTYGDAPYDGGGL